MTSAQAPIRGALRTMASPNGYPELGLAPVTITLRYQRNANLHKLERRIEAWEQAHGNAGFEARNLHRLPGDLAFELANVYIALREWYPLVLPDFVNFAAENDFDLLALATRYPYEYPRLRDVTGVWDDPEETAERLEANGTIDRATRRELAKLAGVVTVHSSGKIEMYRWFNTHRGQAHMVKFLNHRNEIRARSKRPQRMPKVEVTPAALIMVHEFAHLLEGELARDGWQALEPMYATMSRIMLGNQNPDPAQWRHHLINYPTDAGGTPGPNMGTRARQKQTVKALTPILAKYVGSYGPEERDELFAETFAYAHCANRVLRTELRPVLTTLTEQNARRRRRNRY